MLYEDDFEFEEQPANLRDRAVPGERRGTGGGRGPGGGGGYGGGPRGPRRPYTNEHKAKALPDDAKPARELLGTLLEKMGLANVEIAYIPRPEGEYLEVSGPDLAMLIGRYGNTLEAINAIFNNIINTGNRNARRYFTIDAEGYRARRADDLKELAFASVETAVRTKKPQKLEPMLPSERKIVHMTLQEDERVRTESEGVEPERRLVIFPV
jgi:spoIIIJ-associated protein